jgi:hypothetical protein
LNRPHQQAPSGRLVLSHFSARAGVEPWFFRSVKHTLGDDVAVQTSSDDVASAAARTMNMQLMTDGEDF